MALSVFSKLSKASSSLVHNAKLTLCAILIKLSASTAVNIELALVINSSDGIDVPGKLIL